MATLAFFMARILAREPHPATVGARRAMHRSHAVQPFRRVFSPSRERFSPNLHRSRPCTRATERSLLAPADLEFATRRGGCFSFRELTERRRPILGYPRGGRTASA